MPSSSSGVSLLPFSSQTLNMAPKATADICRDLLPDKWEKKL